MDALAKTTHISRLLRWAWRFVSMVAIGLTCFLMCLSPGWVEIGDGENWPVPYPKPAFAQGFPAREQVSEWLGVTAIPVQASIPDKPLFRGMTAGQREVRNYNLESGWTEKWLTAQGSSLIVEAYEYREQRLRPKPVYDAKDDWDIPGAEGATVQHEQSDAARTEMGLVRGRIWITVTLTLSGGNPIKQSKETLTSIAQYLTNSIPETADKPLPADTPKPTERQAMRLAWAFLFLCAIILSANTAWRQGRERGRILAKFSAARRNPAFTDITRSTAWLRSRSRAIALLRLASVASVILVAQLNDVSFELVNAFALATLATSVVVERLVKRQPNLSAPKRRIKALPLLCLLIGWGIAGWMAWGFGGTIYQALTNLTVGDPESPLPYWMVMSTDLTAIALMLVVWPTIFVPIWLSRKLARKVLTRDGSVDLEHTLLLRNFSDDGLKMRAHRTDRSSWLDQLLFKRRATFEELAIRQVGQYGQTYAVGRLGELLPPAVGAERLYFSDDEWQAEVAKLAEGAKLVTVLVARSQWLQWEIELLRERGLLHKTVFLIPPVKRKERLLRLAVLADVLGLPPETLDQVNTGRSVAAVIMPMLSPTQVIAADRLDDLTYSLAISRCVETLNTEEFPTDEGRPEVMPVPSPLSMGSSRLPRPQVFSGRAPSSKPRPWFITLKGVVVAQVLSSMLVGSLINFAPMGAGKRHVTIMSTQVVFDIVAVNDEFMWLLHAGKTLIRTPLPQESASKKETETIGHLPDAAFATVTDGEWFYASVIVGDKLGDYGVAAFNLHTGEKRWGVSTSRWVQDLELVDGRLFFVDGDSTLRALNAETGEPVGEHELGCFGWGIAAVGTSQLGVTCPLGDQLVLVDPLMLQRIGEAKICPGALEVIPFGAGGLANCPMPSAFVPLNPEASPIYLRRASAIMATYTPPGEANPVAAYENVDSVSVFGKGWGKSYPAVSDVRDLVFTPSGDLIISDGSTFVRWERAGKR